MLGRLALTGNAEQTASFDAGALRTELLRYAFFRLGNLEDAEDVVAEVVRDANRQRAKIAETDNPRIYVVGMARRRVADFLRRQARRVRSRSLADPTFVPPATDGDLAAAARRLMVAEILRGLSDDAREALVLKYIQGFAAEEIAGITGRSVPAVHSLLQRAREAFAAAAGDTFTAE